MVVVVTVGDGEDSHGENNREVDKDGDDDDS